MTKDEAYKIFISEITNNDADLIKLVNKNVIMPVAFDYVWTKASKNQIIDSDEACELLKNNGCFSSLRKGSQTIEDVENYFRSAIQAIVLLTPKFY